jgi:hypothetical protein
MVGLPPVAANCGFVRAERLHVGLAVTGGVEEPTQVLRSLLKRL